MTTSIKGHAQRLAVIRVHQLYSGDVTIEETADLTRINVRQVRRIADEREMIFKKNSLTEVRDGHRAPDALDMIERGYA